MIEVLEFIFQDSWHWLGTAILIAIIFRVNLIKIGPITKNKEEKKIRKFTPDIEAGTSLDIFPRFYLSAAIQIRRSIAMPEYFNNRILFTELRDQFA